ncbi:hypothetical protein BY996DRAFT_2688696 [Phakopsora pachyrhizi]|nr:hypothetical protein BY996DRAFT_2688696 [Phakopsora pachyrhizi]
MSNKFPSLPAPRFAPQKPSPLGQQSAATPPPSEPPRSTNNSNQSISQQVPQKKKKKKPTPAFDTPGPGKQFATQIFKLVDALKTNGGPMNLSDLEAVTGVRGLLTEHTDTAFNQDLYDAFNAHDRVNVSDRGMVKLWSYRIVLFVQPDFLINNSHQVLELLKRFSSRGGMPVNTLKQSWPGVMTAITEVSL